MCTCLRKGRVDERAWGWRNGDGLCQMEQLVAWWARLCETAKAVRVGEAGCMSGWARCDETAIQVTHTHAVA